MPVLVRNIMLEIDEPEEKLPDHLARRLKVPVSVLRHYSVVSRAIDARRDSVRLAFHVEVSLNEPAEKERKLVRGLRDVTWLEDRDDDIEPTPGTEPIGVRPCIVGFGPAGMFAALRLARSGFKPIVLERGREVRRRHKDIMQRYYRDRDFDAESNLLYGEGGAGTYSDGKLYTRVNDPLCRFVLETLYQFGADPDILVNTRPHIGSDRLPTICTRLRQHIESLGGEIRFDTALTDIEVSDEGITRWQSIHRDRDEPAWEKARVVMIGLGHSARDTIRMLHKRGVGISAKPFQIGVRVEHPQEMIDKRQFGGAAGHQRLGPAEYHLVAKGAAAGRDMFSFCMCPGGQILPTNEQPGLIATNGASRANRSGEFANSGLVITMDPAEMGLSALDSLAFQEKWERLAFESTGGSYAVPCQRASDFLKGKTSDGDLKTSYPLGGQWADISGVVPPQVSESLLNGLALLDKKIPGFSGDWGIITAPETRASAPIRMDRDSDLRTAKGIDGLYPIGEGAGFAGGIISAAVDGIKSADSVIRRFSPIGI